ncbi:hypothetical protein CYMTET_13973 [Cymbomonas tetramitiformis]|uniref:Eukaryotic translation initiation factor 3 30 kDa subunit n=1 Tax=Cymbomonas tetramitiformis TaxID=36881 RepID=A0AAE0GHB8_9CHLO|nr:hypothetical protein CYMTET_13973 [Cymbomonas tetramitiformis]|eukprot:gene3689-4626_t
MDDLDWDDDDYEPPAITTTAADAKKFEEEEEEEEEKPTKGAVSNKKASKGKAAATQEVVDETLDDPVAEKLRQQKLVEAADFEAAQELFGGSGVDLDTFVPKNEKEFNMYAEAVAGKYLRPVMGSAFFAEALKTLLKKATTQMTAAEVKEVESCVVVIRNEKVKAEKPVTKKKGTKKGQLNLSAGGDLDDINYYQEKAMDDDYDFM